MEDKIIKLSLFISFLLIFLISIIEISHGQTDCDSYDDFEGDSLDGGEWWTVHGTPFIENGWLVLTSSLSDTSKTEVQSNRNFLFSYNKLEILAYSSHWASDLSDSTIDTSVGLEIFFEGNHQGIVITNGHLGILNSTQDSIREEYHSIPGWDTLKANPNKFKIIWTENSIDLFINDLVAVSNDSVSQELIPDRAMKIRLNSNVDLNFNRGVEVDTLKIDYVCYDTTVIVGIAENQTEIPVKFALNQNYPNPFNPSTKITFSILNSDFVTLKIYDILGREIQTLVNEFQKADTYSVNFDASKLSSGIYFYRLQVGDDFVETKKMLLMR